MKCHVCETVFNQWNLSIKEQGVAVVTCHCCGATREIYHTKIETMSETENKQPDGQRSDTASC